MASFVRNLLMVPLKTWGRLKVMMQEVGIEAKREEESGVEQGDEQEGHNVDMRRLHMCAESGDAAA
jgi:hypothetical protein